jgi:hypothetical protein
MIKAKSIFLQGLRTLCVAKAELSDSLFFEWSARYSKMMKEKNTVKNEKDEKLIEKKISLVI